ncbi:MAG: hypothetical protein H6862_01455 [Rhodospirillales bacterium]|nr:hypothetical protein [Rhodospirillales bacterium]
MALANFDSSKHVVAAQSPAALARAFGDVCVRERPDYEGGNPLRKVSVFTHSGEGLHLKNGMWTTDGGYMVLSVMAVKVIRELRI